MKMADGTRDYILPYAEQVNLDMFRELSDLVDNREQMLRLMEPNLPD